MNIGLLEDFLGQVVEEACYSLQIQARDSNEYVTEDPRVLLCAKAAYAMIVSYINRSLVKDTYNEYYFEEDTRIRLRNNPVESITQVNFVDNPYSVELTLTDMSSDLVEDVDYTLRLNKDLLIAQEALSQSIGDSDRVHILIEYIGGIAYSVDDPNIHLALVMQTIALYNRLPVLGISQMQGNESTSRGASGQMNLASSPDAGDLLDTVKTILAPYVYHGSAENA